MNKKTIYLLFFVLTLTNYSVSQNIIGKVIDESTNQPIAFVEIYLNSGFGTITNENGDFIIDSKKIGKSDTLFISHVSYEKKEVLISESKGFQIKLKPLITLLKEVVVYSNDNTFKLVNAVYDQIKSNDTNYFGKGFYRQTTFNNNVPSEIHEIFLDVSYSANGINKYASKEARFAKTSSTKEKPLVSFTNQLALTINFSLAPEGRRLFVRPFNEGFDRDIDFTITGELSTKSGNYLVISYHPVVASANSMKGSLIVNKSNNCLCKYESETNSNLGIDTIRSVHNNLPAFNHSFKFLYLFDCENNSQSRLTYASVATHFETKLGPVDIESKFFIYASDLKTLKKLKDFDLTDKDLDIIKNTKYHSDFWKENEIIKRTPIEEKTIEAFEKSNSFGNYFPKK